MSRKRKSSSMIISIVIALSIIIVASLVFTYIQVKQSRIDRENLLIHTSMVQIETETKIDILGNEVGAEYIDGIRVFPISGDVLVSEHYPDNVGQVEINSFYELEETLSNLEGVTFRIDDVDGEYQDINQIEDFEQLDKVNKTTEYNLCISKTYEYDATYDNEDEIVGNIALDLEYNIKLTYIPQITLVSDKTEYLQGDMITLTATGFENAEVQTNLMHDIIFFENDNVHTAFVAVDVTQAAGDYYIDIVRGDEVVKTQFSVLPRDFEVQYLTVEPSVAAASVGNTEEVERYSNTYAEVIKIADDTLYATEPFIAPVDGYITTEFGTQRYDLGRTTPRWHSAIDIGGNAIGTPIAASNSGRVVMSDFFANTGNAIIIEHGFGLKTIYMHMDERYVEVGDYVQIGDSIGTIGTTGYSTGAHLHFGVIANGVYVSPLYDYN